MSALGFRTPVRFLRGSWGRLGLTVIALACGVALVCAIDLSNRAVLAGFQEIIDTVAGRAQLQVVAGDSGLFADGLVDDIALVPGVERAVPVIASSAFLVDDGAMLTVYGVDVADDTAVRLYEPTEVLLSAPADTGLGDPLVFLSQADSVALARPFADRRGLRVGDRITLETPTGRHGFQIRGLLEPAGMARLFGGNLLVMDVYAAEQVFTRPGLVNRIDVLVARDRMLDGDASRPGAYTVRRTAEAIQSILPPGLQVVEPAHRKQDIGRIVGALQTLLQAVALLAMVAAFLIAFNRLSTVFEGRAWQLGIMRAAGVRAAVVRRELLKESVLVGLAGVALGMPLGVAVARVLHPMLATMTSLAVKMTEPAAALRLRPSSFVIAAAVGLGAAVLAALLPAWRASRLSIADTLRGRGVEQPGALPRWAWAIRGIVVVAVVAAVGMQQATRHAAWGLFATALLAVLAGLAARTLLQGFAPILGIALTAVAGPSGRFATATLLGNPRRAALTIATLGVGFGSVLWLGTVAQSFERSVVDTLTATFRADLIVSSAHVASGYNEAPLDEGAVAEIAALADVDGAAGWAVVEWQHAGGGITLNAFDPAFFTDARFGGWPLTGPHPADAWTEVAAGRAVVVSGNFALHLSGDVGDTITLDTPKGPLALPIVGVTMDPSSPRGAIEMSRALYAEHWGDPHVTRVLVTTRRGADAGTVGAAIARRFADRYRLRVLSSGELVAYFATQVRRAFSGVDVLNAIVLMVVFVAITDTLAAGVAERTRELGAVRAVGARRRAVRRIVLVEGLVVGGLGLVLALGLGFSLGTLWVETTYPYLLGWVLELYVPYRKVAMVTAMIFGACLAGASIPARQAANLEPAVALRYE